MPDKPKSAPSNASKNREKELQKTIIKSHQHLGYSATQWFEWMVDDCLAGMGKKLEKPWEKKQNQHLFELSGLYGQSVAQAPFEDVLGSTYQELATNYGRKSLGQYFTPKAIAKMMAQLTYDRKSFESQPVVRLSEPTTGSGVMILAFMEAVIEDDPAFLNKLSITCVDKDLLCVKMSVLQVLANNLFHAQNLGELVAYHGDSLGNPADLAFFYGASTPEYMAGLVEERSQLEKKAAQETENPQAPETVVSPNEETPGQLELGLETKKVPPKAPQKSAHKKSKKPGDGEPRQLDLFD